MQFRFHVVVAAKSSMQVYVRMIRGDGRRLHPVPRRLVRVFLPQIVRSGQFKSLNPSNFRGALHVTDMKDQSAYGSPRYARPDHRRSGAATTSVSASCRISNEDRHAAHHEKTKCSNGRSIVRKHRNQQGGLHVFQISFVRAGGGCALRAGTCSAVARSNHLADPACPVRGDDRRDLPGVRTRLAGAGGRAGGGAQHHRHPAGRRGLWPDLDLRRPDPDAGTRRAGGRGPAVHPLSYDRDLRPLARSTC